MHIEQNTGRIIGVNGNVIEVTGSFGRHKVVCVWNSTYEAEARNAQLPLRRNAAVMADERTIQYAGN